MRSIASERPDLLAEWHLTRNGELTPNEVSFGSTRKVWWRCRWGHEWQASPNNRSKGQGCPYCAGRRVLAGFNDLATTDPEIAAEWHPTRNGELTPRDVTRGSHRKVWWRCRWGHEWEASVTNRAKGCGCPVCASAERGFRRSRAALRQNGSLAERYPELLEDWDYERNELDPAGVSSGSTLRTHWRCHVCGYRWVSAISKRSTGGHGCPACAGKAVNPGVNDLATMRPDVAAEWDAERNGALAPSDVTVGSNKRVWWRCGRGHSWQATVAARTAGSGCPYCSNQRVWQGFNDLATMNPELAAEWHPTRNGDLTPNDVTAGSTRRKVWWLCPLGHEYRATPASRSHGSGCPTCAMEGKTSFPEQAVLFYLGRLTRAEGRFSYDGRWEIDVWLPDLNTGIEYDGAFWHASPSVARRERLKEEYLAGRGVRLIRVREVQKDEELPPDEGDRIFCKYAQDGSHIAAVVSRLLAALRLAGDPDVDVERDRAEIYARYVEGRKAESLLATSPELAAEWHPTRNGALTPDKVSRSSGKRVWWVCESGHEWQASVDNRARGNGCPYCSGKRVIAGFNDLATTDPEIAAEWHPTRNGGLTPRDVTRGSSRVKPWWVCPEGHEYRATPANRIAGRGCPTCSVAKRSRSRHEAHLKTHESIAETHPELCREWDAEGNGSLTPHDVTSGSDAKVWWVCERGHRYEATVANRVGGRGCPYCAGKRVLPGFNDLATVAPEVAAEWHPTRNGDLTPSDVGAGSHGMAWWLCSEGHEWRAQIKSRVQQGVGCPYCSNKRVLRGYNDLATRYPEIAAEWDWERNGDLTPSDVVFGSGKKVWWRCPEGHSWQMPIYRRVEGRGCPDCRKRGQ